MLEPLSYPSSLTSKFAQAMKHERHQQRVLQAARAADYARMCSEQKLERAQRNCMYLRVALRVAACDFSEGRDLLPAHHAIVSRAQTARTCLQALSATAATYMHLSVFARTLQTRSLQRSARWLRRSVQR